MAVAGARFEMDAASRSRQIAELQQLDILHDVPENELLLLLDHLVFRAFEPGITFHAERSSASHCYFIVHGTLWTKLHDKDDHEALLGALSRGDCFGAGSLFGLRDRCSAVYAETICYLLQLRLDDLRELLPRMPALATALRRYYRRRLVQTTLGRAPLFSHLPPVIRQSIGDRLVRVQADRNTEILRQGDPGEAFYIIELGQVAVEQNGVVIAHLSEGDFFGEISLLQAQPHTATVRTLTPTHLLKLPGADFARLIEEQPELYRQVQSVIETRLQEAAAIRSDEKRIAELEIVVQYGLMRGRQLLVRRPHLCPPGCRICEEACTSRFGQPRLHLNGVTVGNYDVPTACRQCQFGAECVEACPEEAIIWDEGGMFYVNDRCTGCGKCVPACPYDAIELVERVKLGDVQQQVSLFQQVWARIHPKRATQPTPQIADKCDLCHGYSDKACLNQCPTGSLQLISIDALFPRG